MEGLAPNWSLDHVLEVKGIRPTPQLPLVANPSVAVIYAAPPP